MEKQAEWVSISEPEPDPLNLLPLAIQWASGVNVEIRHVGTYTDGPVEFVPIEGAPEKHRPLNDSPDASDEEQADT